MRFYQACLLSSLLFITFINADPEQDETFWDDVGSSARNAWDSVKASVLPNIEQKAVQYTADAACKATSYISDNTDGLLKPLADELAKDTCDFADALKSGKGSSLGGGSGAASNGRASKRVDKATDDAAKNLAAAAILPPSDSAGSSSTSPLSSLPSSRSGKPSISNILSPSS
jgi:hypothetical protein